MRKLIDEKVNWWESQLMRESIDEKVNWWESQLMRKSIDEKVDWWESWLMRKSIDWLESWIGLWPRTEVQTDRWTMVVVKSLSWLKKWGQFEILPGLICSKCWISKWPLIAQKWNISAKTWSKVKSKDSFELLKPSRFSTFFLLFWKGKILMAHGYYTQIK